MRTNGRRQQLEAGDRSGQSCWAGMHAADVAVSMDRKMLCVIPGKVRRREGHVQGPQRSVLWQLLDGQRCRVNQLLAPLQGSCTVHAVAQRRGGLRACCSSCRR